MGEPRPRRPAARPITPFPAFPTSSLSHTPTPLAYLPSRTGGTGTARRPVWAGRPFGDGGERDEEEERLCACFLFSGQWESSRARAGPVPLWRRLVCAGVGACTHESVCVRVSRGACDDWGSQPRCTRRKRGMALTRPCPPASFFRSHSRSRRLHWEPPRPPVRPPAPSPPLLPRPSPLTGKRPTCHTLPACRTRNRGGARGPGRAHTPSPPPRESRSRPVFIYSNDGAPPTAAGPLWRRRLRPDLRPVLRACL